MLLMREFFFGRSLMVAGSALTVVDGILMISSEDFIKLFYVARRTRWGCLIFPRCMMAGSAVLVLKFGVCRVGENDFAALVIKQDAHGWSIRPSWD